MEVQEDDGWADDGEWEEIEEVEEISSGPAATPVPPTATCPSDESDKRRKLDPAEATAPTKKVTHTSSTATAAPAVTSAGADDTGSGKQASHPVAMATALASSLSSTAQITAKDPPSPRATTKPAPDHGRDAAAAALPDTSAAAATVAVGALPPVAERHDTRHIEFVEGESGSVVKVGGLNFRVIPLQALRIPGSERYRS